MVAPTGPTRLRSLLVDALLVVANLAVLGLVLMLQLERSEHRAIAVTAAEEARQVFAAFDRYYEMHDSYPEAGTPDYSDALELLRRRGYYSGDLAPLLIEDRIDGYDSPDDRGRNQEFWLEMTLRQDPRVRFVVARSDDAPTAAGKWLDGVYVLRQGRLEAL